MEVAIRFERGGVLMFEGACQVPAERTSAELGDLRYDLQRMCGYANQGGRHLTMSVRESSVQHDPTIPGAELIGALVSLLKHDGVINAETLTPHELIAAVQDHIIVADTDKMRAKDNGRKGGKATAKKAAAKKPAAKPAKKAAKKNKKQQELDL